MKAILSSTALILGMMASAGVYAAAPAGATGLCKDGSYYTGANKQGACRGHKGVQDWYGPAAGASATVGATAAVTTPTTAPAATPAPEKKGMFSFLKKKPATTTTTPTTSAIHAGAPAGATGLCNDGSYYNGANKQGACRGHKGVKDWYGPAAGAAVGATVAASATTSSPVAAPAAAPEKKGMFSFLNKKPATTAAAPAAAAATTAAPAVVAAGGGAGKVWVNTDSHVYHCEGSHWYGKTKTGSYMTEAAAVAAGARPDHGKACH